MAPPPGSGERRPDDRPAAAPGPQVAGPGSQPDAVGPWAADLDDELVSVADEAGLAAAALLADGLDRIRTTVSTKSTATDLVTEMDRASERLIVDTILARRPADALLGEEGTERPGRSGVRWVIDPLDGTTNYVYRHPGFAVSIAAQVDGVTRVGLVVDVATGVCYRAVQGAGATGDGRPLAVSGGRDLAQALVATGFGYDRADRGHQGRVLATVLPEIRDIRRMGSAALDLCSVAGGRVDAYYELTLSPWDWAAGALIAAEAGAVVCDLAGRPPSQGVVLAAPPALIEPLRHLLGVAGAASISPSD